MSDTVYRKEGGKYVPIAPGIFNGFPSDGMWLVKFKNGSEKSASCIARLDNLPDPYPFYNMMLSRDEISTFLLNVTNGEAISIQEIADRLIKYLAELHKPDHLKIKYPNPPNNNKLKLPTKI